MAVRLRLSIEVDNIINGDVVSELSSASRLFGEFSHSLDV